MFWSKKSVFRSLPDLRHLCDDEGDRLWKHIEKTDWGFGWLSTIVGITMGITWFLAFCMICILLWDPMDPYPPAELGWAGDLLLLGGSVGVGTVLTFFSGSLLQFHLLHRHMVGDLMARRCLWCGYCLTGLESEGGRVRCPECGERSPVRSDPE